jgi:hypothetical protein
MTDDPNMQRPTIDELLAAARREPGNVLRAAMDEAATMRDERVAEGDALLGALYNTFAAVCTFVRDERREVHRRAESGEITPPGRTVGVVTVTPDSDGEPPGESEGE